jgi:hypothetical protein
MGFLDDGTLIVCGEYSGDLQQICRVLNKWIFDSNDDPIKFFVKEGRIVPDLYVTPLPSTYPYREWLELPDGRRIPYDEAKENDFIEDDPDFDCEEINLKRMSREISPLLTQGTLELVVVGHCELRQVYLERLAIAASGVVERRSQIFFSYKPADWVEPTTERYDPALQSPGTFAVCGDGGAKCT